MCKPKFRLGISINRCLSRAKTLKMLGDRGAQHLGWPCEDRGGNLGGGETMSQGLPWELGEAGGSLGSLQRGCGACQLLPLRFACSALEAKGAQ